MSALEKAKQIAKEKKIRELEARARKEDEIRIDASRKNHFIDTIDKAVKEFHGVSGIKVEINDMDYPICKEGN